MKFKREKAKAIKILWLLLAVFWMALIFRFSGQRAQVSGELSGSISYRMAERAEEWFSFGWGEDELLHYGAAWEYPLRKAAHMTEYGILAIIFLGNFSQYPFTFRKKYFLAWICAACYAATDEFHQLFVEGRSGQISDVCIDSAGAFLGLFAVYVLIKLFSGLSIDR